MKKMKSQIITSCLTVLVLSSYTYAQEGTQCNTNVNTGQ